MIRHFNSFNRPEPRPDEFIEFCTNYLANLTDNNFKLSFDATVRSSYFTLNIISLNMTTRYSDIKDHFIPFMIVLNDNYHIREIEFFLNIENFRIDYNTVVNDRLSKLERPRYNRLHSISLMVEERNNG